MTQAILVITINAPGFRYFLIEKMKTGAKIAEVGICNSYPKVTDLFAGIYCIAGSLVYQKESRGTLYLF